MSELVSIISVEVMPVALDFKRSVQALVENRCRLQSPPRTNPWTSAAAGVPGLETLKRRRLSMAMDVLISPDSINPTLTI